MEIKPMQSAEGGGAPLLVNPPVHVQRARHNDPHVVGQGRAPGAQDLKADLGGHGRFRVMSK